MLLWVCSYSQVKANEYEINSESDFVNFADNVNKGIIALTADDEVILNADLDLSNHSTTMIGTSARPFKGYFFGEGHTIKLALNNTESQYTALFRYCKDAKIWDLRTTGSVYSNQKFVGGVAGYMEGDCELFHVVSDANLTCNLTGDITTGGLIANCQNIWLRYCGFAGTITAGIGNNNSGAGGLVGWNSTSFDMAYCYIAFTTTNITSGMLFIRHTHSSNKIVNRTSLAMLNTMTKTNSIDESDYMQNTKKYTAEEFASGKVAYMMSCIKDYTKDKDDPARDSGNTFHHYPSISYNPGEGPNDDTSWHDGWHQKIGTEAFPGVSLKDEDIVYEGQTNGEYFYVNEDGYYDNTITLTDGKPYFCQVGFTAKKVYYQRTMSNYSWGTICLPFDYSSNTRNFKLYEPTVFKKKYEGINTPEQDTLFLERVTDCLGNTPSIFRKEYGKEIVVTYNDKEIYPAESASSGMLIEGAQLSRYVLNDEMVFCGTYEQTSIIDATGGGGYSDYYYFVAQDLLWSPTVRTTINPFRAYIASKVGGDLAKSVVLFCPDEEDEATDITRELLSDSNEKVSGAIYNLNGQRLSAPIKGQINIVNGKKYLGK